MASDGTEAVTLSQLKEWSDTLGGFSPAISTVRLSNNHSNLLTFTYMGVDGAHSASIPLGETMTVQAPIMSMVKVNANTDRVVVRGGCSFGVTEILTHGGVDRTLVCVTDTTCTISVHM